MYCPVLYDQMLVGETIRFSYYNQQGLTVDPDYRIYEFVKDTAAEALALPQQSMSDGPVDASPDSLARSLLSRFQFPPGRWMDPVAKLSGI